MKVILVLLICGLVHKSIEQDGNPHCCVTYYDGKLDGTTIRYCDGNDTCINLAQDWKYRIGSVGLENWPAVQDTETSLYSLPGCTGNSVHISYPNACSGDLSSETWLDSIGIHNDRCGYKGMYKNSQSLRIQCRVPYQGRPITDYTIKVQSLTEMDTQRKFVINQKIDEAKIFMEATGVVLDVAALVPYLGEFAGLVKFLAVVFVDDSDHDRMQDLADQIVNEAKRLIAMEGFRSMNATMKVVTQNMEFLNNSRSSEMDRVAIVHNIHDGLYTVVSRLYDERSIYREYPMLAINSLLSLVPVIALFHPIAKVISPTLVEDSKLFCDHYHAIVQYQTLTVGKRLDSFHYLAVERAKPFIDEVKNRPYSLNGYLDGKDRIKCLAWPCEFPQYQCLVDPVNREGIYSQSGDVKECFQVYAELVRTRMEEAFAKPLEMSKKYCTE